MDSYVIIAGDSGVYSGNLVSLDAPNGVAVLRGARHLRRYYVKGRVGDGSAADLAIHGLDPASPSITDPVRGESTLIGVRRVFPVGPSALDTFR